MEELSLSGPGGEVSREGYVGLLSAFFSNLSERTEVRSLEVVLVGNASNRDGLGARVTVRAGGRDLTRYHDGKSGYLSQSSMPLYFGLGGAASIESVTVEWPDGRVSMLQGV